MYLPLQVAFEADQNRAKYQPYAKFDSLHSAQYIENLKQVFPEMELRGLSPNSYINVSVSD